MVFFFRALRWDGRKIEQKIPGKPRRVEDLEARVGETNEEENLEIERKDSKALKEDMLG